MTLISWKKNPEKSLWGGFHGRFKTRRSEAGRTRPTRKSRVSATKIKILRKTEHISKIVLPWVCLPIFLTIQPNLATGSAKNQKRQFSPRVGRPSICPRHFALFWPLIFSQMDSYAGMLKIKGQFKVTCKKIGQNRIMGKNLGGEANLPPPA